MFKLKRFFLSSFLVLSVIFFVSCEDEELIDAISSNDGVQARLAFTEKGYTEVEVTPIVKINCYFPDWDKDVMTPVSGLFEYYDADSNWIASINFGDGSCDEWATKTWNVNIFTDDPIGTSDFSVFNYKNKK